MVGMNLRVSFTMLETIHTRSVACFFLWSFHNPYELVTLFYVGSYFVTLGGLKESLATNYTCVNRCLLLNSVELKHTVPRKPQTYKKINSHKKIPKYQFIK